MKRRKRDETDNPESTTCCILFATADWDEPYWTNKQHCAKALANLGVKVLYVESIGLRMPKGNSHKDIIRILGRIKKAAYSYLVGPRKCEERVYVISPFTLPGIGSSAFKARLNEWMLDFLVRSSSSRLKLRNIKIWAYHPFIGNCWRMPMVSRVLYHCVDDLSSVPGIDRERFRLAEARFLELVADVCYVTAPHLKKQCQPHNSNTYYLSNVVDIDHFSQQKEARPECPAELASIRRPRIAYHGVLSDFKIDFGLLIECARLKPEWSFVLIGEEREGQHDLLVDELRSMKNVHLLGYRSYKQLPAYLNNMDIGILPSLINSYTTSMFPMKFYEYIASRIPVVSTPLDFTKHVEGGLLVGKNPAEFVNAIRLQIEQGRLSAEESQRIIGDNTWKARTLKMLKSLEETS